jgi:hypothetical protein
MIKAFKKWIAKAAQEGMHQPAENLRANNKLYDMFLDTGAAVVAFQISNGFVVRTMNMRNTTSIIEGSRVPGFTYCADHKAIADYLVSSAVKQKLGVQSDMFEKEKQEAQVQRKQVNITPRGNTIGAQSNF